MSKLFPELVFTKGPQKGQHVPLSKMMNILGRERAACDIELKDEYASRQHARIIVEDGRVRLINTSPNGTRVNGKPAEQVVLNHGDLIGYGLEGEARYEAVDAPAPAAANAAVTAPLPAAAGQAKPAAAGEEPAAAEKKKFKKPTAIVWVGVYLVALFAVFGLLKLLTADKGDPWASATRSLSDEDIETLINAPLTAEKNEHLASEALANAYRRYEAWQTGTTGPEHLYETLLEFKKALAHRQQDGFGTEIYRSPTGRVILTQDMYKEIRYGERDDKGNIVRPGLIDEVRVAYKNAYAFQRQGQWRRAQENYHAVQRMIPDLQHPICKNVREQLNVVNAAILKQKEKAGPKM